MKKVVAVILAVCLVLSLGAVAFASSYNDVPEGFYAEDAIERWTQYGVFSGDDAGNFTPSKYMTRAEAAAIMARLFKLSEKADVSQYEDLEDGAWYVDSIAMCVAAGILKGTGETTMAPLDYLTREQFFVMFARGLGIAEESVAKYNITDEDEISSWAKGYIYALVNGGFVKGTSADSYTINPQEYIARADMAVLLDQTISVYAAEAGATVPYEGEGIVLVVADNVSITDAPAGTLVVTRNATGTKVNGKDVGNNTEYVVPEEPAEEEEEEPAEEQTHAEIIDAAVARYVRRLSLDYAELKKDGDTITVTITDPEVRVGYVYSEIGEGLLSAVNGQKNPALVEVTCEGESLAIQAELSDLHDFVYAVTGASGNTEIGTLDGETFTVAFVDDDCDPFEYTIVFAVEE